MASYLEVLSTRFLLNSQIVLAMQLDLNAILHQHLVFSPKAAILNKFKLNS
jgi:hypothetical protein